MEHKIKFYLALPIMVISLASCLKDADITGMIISDESVNRRFEQSKEWNTNHPDRSILVKEDNYLILCMGDSHVGGTHNLSSFLDSALIKKVLTVVMIGDLTTGQESDYDLFNRYLPGQDLLPSFQVAGNHDLYFGGWQHFYSRFGSSSYYFSILTPAAKDLFICLDTGGGTLGSKQLEWFKNVLQNTRPDYRNCIVCTHNNLFRFRRTSSTNPLPEELHVLLDLFTRYNVDMVITAHDHKRDEQVFGNTTHIVMDALKDGEENAGYFQLEINEGNIEYKFVNF